jgi:ureidoglycolate lyase
MNPVLKIEPLSAEAFAPFGEVIETENRDYFMINNGSTRRYHQLTTVDTGAEDGRCIISIFRAKMLDYPLTVSMLERHPNGSQAFIPLKNQAFLIVVATGGETPDEGTLRAFLSNGHQGINYGRAVWHHPVLALDNDDEFLIVDRAGTLANCDERWLEQPRMLSLPALPSV